MALGNNLKKLREDRGLSQDELSTLTNGAVSQGTISALEKRDSASSEFAVALAAALKVSVNELLTGVSENYVVVTQEELEWLAMRKKLGTSERDMLFKFGNSLVESDEKKPNNGTHGAQ